MDQGRGGGPAQPVVHEAATRPGPRPGAQAAPFLGYTYPLVELRCARHSRPTGTEALRRAGRTGREAYAFRQATCAPTLPSTESISPRITSPSASRKPRALSRNSPTSSTTKETLISGWFRGCSAGAGGCLCLGSVLFGPVPACWWRGVEVGLCLGLILARISSGILVQTNECFRLFQLLMNSQILPINSRTETKVPPRMA